jgi:ornithine decarboxylase
VFYDVETPCLLLDVERVVANLPGLRSAFGALRPRVFYAAKANGDPRLLAALHAVGCGFDVASLNEIRRLQALGVPATDLTFSATVKLPTTSGRPTRGGSSASPSTTRPRWPSSPTWRRAPR